MTDATLSLTAAPTYEGTNRLILGIVLAVVTFWLFAQTTLNVAPTMRDDLHITNSASSFLQFGKIFKDNGLPRLPFLQIFLTAIAKIECPRLVHAAGFFLIENFVIHPERRGGQRTDADLLAVRFPHRAALGRLHT